MPLRCACTELITVRYFAIYLFLSRLTRRTNKKKKICIVGMNELYIETLTHESELYKENKMKAHVSIKKREIK